jgi:hypothetical protein
MMAVEDTAFIHCYRCSRNFYIELITEEENYPLPTWCPFCGKAGLGDMEEVLDKSNKDMETALRKQPFAVINGGKKHKQEKENAEKRDRKTDVGGGVEDERGGESS